jgi:hypothetical protein
LFMVLVIVILKKQLILVSYRKMYFKYIN